MSRELVRFWKGSEGSYRELYIRGRIKDNVKYTVICDDGTVKEYLGNVPLGSCELEQMPFVDDVIGASAFKESFEKNPSSYKNKRILVGDDLAFGGDGKLLDEYTPTEGVEQANASAISKEVTDRKAAINALSASTKGGEGKFIQSVKEDKGIITAVEADLTAAAVAYNKTGDKVITSATNVSAAIKELDAKVAANKDAELTYKTVKLTAEEVTKLGDANVKEAYKVVSVDKARKETTVGDIIKIYKDSALVSIDYTETGENSKKGQFLKYVYTLADGTQKTVYVDMSELVDQAEVEKGIQAVGGKLSIKLAEGNEAGFLTVDANGLKLSGVQTAIDTAKNAVQGKLDAEINRAKAAEKANADAIEVLNGDKTTTGSVAKAVADAKADLLGDAAAEYNTLGKLEDKIQALDVKATKAHTEVTAKAEGHVKVAVANSTDGTHKVVTISENDIASASGLTAEVTRATKAEDKIGASVGLAADGSHAGTNGNYTSGAKTVVGEIAALDTQVKANADAIAAETTRATQAEAKALADANTYTDNALSWIEAGSY